MTSKPNIQTKYEEEVRARLREELGLSTVMAVPRIDRVVLNMGLGAAVADPKIIEGAVKEMTLIAGQKPVVTKARRAIANFKLRAGMPIGVAVTLRRTRMYEFLERLIHVALPRVRDFRGLSRRGFDGHGNYSIGIREQIIFPEVDLDKVQRVSGLSVTIVTSAPNDEQGMALLAALGMPLKK